MPCPLCGGLIHPVAGRCKHCKEDLTSFRAGRPQAAAALPALNGKPQNGSNGHHVATAAPVPVIVASRNDSSQPILPPRTTARSVPVARPHSVWRSWPMLVIILAGIAIITATVIMVMPQGNKHDSGKMSAPPAPERMDTNPLPEKQSQIDPWDHGGGGGVVPRTPDPVPAPVQPQAPDPDDDLWSNGGGTGGLGGTLGGGALGGADFMLTVIDHACAKLASCPNVDQSGVKPVCDQLAMIPKPGNAPKCAAAQKCLDAIDHMTCSQAQSTSPMSMFTLFDECATATTQC